MDHNEEGDTAGAMDTGCKGVVAAILELAAPFFFESLGVDAAPAPATFMAVLLILVPDTADGVGEAPRVPTAPEAEALARGNAGPRNFFHFSCGVSAVLSSAADAASADAGVNAGEEAEGVKTGACCIAWIVFA